MKKRVDNRRTLAFTLFKHPVTVRPTSIAIKDLYFRSHFLDESVYQMLRCSGLHERVAFFTNEKDRFKVEVEHWINGIVYVIERL